MALSLRIEGGTFVVILVILFIVVGLATFVFLESTGRLSDYKINLFSSIGSDDLIVFEEDIDLSQYEQDINIGQVAEEELIQRPETKDIEKIAERGDSVTTLARKAIKDYVQENGLDFSREHKLFMEDYLQNRISDKDLIIGEKVVFSNDLLEQAKEKAEQLTDAELEELQNYTELVWNPAIE